MRYRPTSTPARPENPLAPEEPESADGRRSPFGRIAGLKEWHKPAVVATLSIRPSTEVVIAPSREGTDSHRFGESPGRVVRQGDPSIAPDSPRRWLDRPIPQAMDPPNTAVLPIAVGRLLPRRGLESPGVGVPGGRGTP